VETYGLLRSGAALGRGCGPLIVGRKGSTLSDLTSTKIAVPGLWTTANLLLGLFCPSLPRVVPLTFDKIMPAVSSGAYDFGVIIHEGRFTFETYGLENLLDLGAWWESETGFPIPLGGIAVRRTLPQEIIAKVESAIRDSIAYAHMHPKETRNYVKTHARELSDEVTQQHISLYVNKFSTDIGDQGASAIHMLFDMARKKGLMPESKKNVFALPFSSLSGP
jgi:1,4-dihydroxy-6-naphthoate synthase